MTIVDEFREDEGRVLDRLVDGELSQMDRRELLVALEDEPDGWRRCALAFLEAQSWRWQLGQVAAEPIVAHATAEARCNTLWSTSHRAGFWGLCLAAAASLLVAFGLGTRFPTTGEPQLAGLEETNVAASSQNENTVAPLEADAAPATVADQTDKPTDDNAWETLTLAFADGADDAETDNQFKVHVRGAEAENVDLDALLAGGESTLPTALVNQLEQEGWTVTRRRQLLPVDLPDGRRMVVPIEQLDIQPPEVAQL